MCRECGGGEPKQCCTRDGGRGFCPPGPPGPALRGRGPKRLQGASVKSRGLSVTEKAGVPPSGEHYEDERKQTFR